jgi:tetratricopeptide (TPR) repeat protein
LVSLSLVAVIGATVHSRVAVAQEHLPSAGATQQSRKPVHIEALVHGAAGEPIARAAVTLEGHGHAFRASGETDAKGQWSIEIVDAGDYTVRAEKDGKSDERSFHVETEGERRVDYAQVILSLAVSAEKAGDTKAMEFDDKPNFTVAGVTDWSNTGIHGSDVSVRTSETLAKETLALKDGRASSDSGGKAGTTVAGAGESEKNLRAEREEARKKLASAETADLHREIGDLDEKLGDPLEAVWEYERAVKLEPSEASYFAWGTELILHKADQPAAEVFAAGSKAHPNSARMLEGMGVALYGAGSYDEAAKKMCEAADLRPADAAAYLFLGKMDKAAPGPLPCAEERLARFAKFHPENAMANYYYGVALRKRAGAGENPDSLRRAEELLQKAVKIDPKFSDGYLQLGIVRSALGEIALAGRDYETAIEIDPQNAEAHYRLGAVYRMTGDKAKAEQEYQTYKRLEKEEAAAAESQRRELRQFVITLKDQPAATPH